MCDTSSCCCVICACAQWGALSCFHHEFPSCLVHLPICFYFFCLLVHISWGVDNPRTVPFVLCCTYIGHVSIMNSSHVSALSDPFLFLSSFGAHIVGLGEPKGPLLLFVLYVCSLEAHPGNPTCIRARGGWPSHCVGRPPHHTPMGGNFSNETNFMSECEAAPPATREHSKTLFLAEMWLIHIHCKATMSVRRLSLCIECVV